MREWLARLIDWFRRGALDRELAEELRFHREHLEQDALASGSDAAAARWSAKRRIGNLDGARIMRSLAKISVAAALMGAVVWSCSQGLERWIEPDSFPEQTIALAIPGFAVPVADKATEVQLDIKGEVRDEQVEVAITVEVDPICGSTPPVAIEHVESACAFTEAASGRLDEQLVRPRPRAFVCPLNAVQIG